jgi:uncharacterized membrane protein YkvA (DUF1232 family)
MGSGMFDSWKTRARALKTELHALMLAYRDPRVSWRARAFAALVVAYAFSPLDLIPDPIPVLGYLDDLVLIPLGVALALRMVPADVMADCRAQALEQAAARRPVSWAGAVLVAAIWIVLAVLVLGIVLRFMR